MITTTVSGCILIWKVPNNIEREINFKSSQKELRLSETPVNKGKKEPDSFAKEFEENLLDHESAHKKWYEKDENKPPIDFSRDTLPEWARSTLGGENLDMDESEFIYQSKEQFTKLQQTVSGDEDSEEENKSEYNKTLQTNKSHSEFGDISGEEHDAFDFEQSRVRKSTISTSQYLPKESRIGNMIRRSVCERDSIRVPNSDTSSVAVKPNFSSDLDEIPETSIKKEQSQKKKSSSDTKKNTKKKNIIQHKSVSQSMYLLFLNFYHF